MFEQNLRTISVQSLMKRKSHSDDGRWTMDDDLDPIFDEEDDHLDDDLDPIFDEEDDHLDDDIGPIFDEEEESEAPFVCKEYDPVKLLRHEEGLQHFIFESGEETRPGLRTNPFKGGGDDATQTISYVSTRSLKYEPAKKLIIASLNGNFMGLIGLIHEVLDPEKLMGLIQNVEALCSIINQYLDLSKKSPL
ncbi:hypothetical protein F2Q69_00059359 [Brassica cretica]|uniref:Uncharacterized protein n=1 Tax=Brassica cretica TaxID=69181 RepID=A0A8S9RPI0_BRACR|nr:hypothetical protein F2Q69_00059359 [Brassica cretica]